ncbi:dynamin family protein [Myxosarcina sp. GI1]|uniref:dynamin family protein n=1 Tax=Myxosarcina sp. GI1 TaxID=1541065 RepID=UPI000566B1FD|nr:dynamin family protein [Myxosarcina sp. GI1]
MSDLIVDKQLVQQKSRLGNLLHQLKNFAAEIKNRQLQTTIENLRKNLDEPFLFVVVGEVKAGKSSFINALLQENICPTAAEPCTDLIQQIVWSDRPYDKFISPYLKKVGLSVEILKTVSIVDTPGTNTVIDNHQAITKQFIPNSDLIFFVFFAKNPYTQSAWELLDYVNLQWRKKVVFILQQADLTKPEELAKNRANLEQLAKQKEISAPIIFATSAELEFNGEANSGFAEVRNYINNTLGANTQKLKLQGVANTTAAIVKQLGQELDNLQQQLEIDRAVVTNIETKLQQNKQQSGFELDSLIIRLLAKYDSITNRVKVEFRDKLTLPNLIKGSFTTLFSANKSAPLWMEELKQSCEAELKTSLRDISQDGIEHFMSGIRQLLRDLLGDLQQMKIDRVDSSNIIIETIENRQEVVEVVQRKVAGLLDGRDFLRSIESISASVAPTFLGGSAATVAGGAIAAITEILILDIIGTAFAGVGILFAGGALLLKKQQMIARFENKLEGEKVRFERELKDRLGSKLDIIYEEIDRNFVEIYNYVKDEEEKVLPLIDKFRQIEIDSQNSLQNIEH